MDYALFGLYPSGLHQMTLADLRPTLAFQYLFIFFF
jgi:hypothetical protein